MRAFFAGWWDTGSGAKRGEASLSKELILAEMHPLDDVSAVVKDTADVLRVDGAREVRVAIVLPISGCRRNAEKLVPDKVLGPHHLFLFIKFQIRIFCLLRNLSKNKPLHLLQVLSPHQAALHNGRNRGNIHPAGISQLGLFPPTNPDFKIQLVKLIKD